MEKLIAELTRLYLAPEAVTREALAQHLAGQQTLAIPLTTADGLVRALAIPFRNWERLCEVANGVQAELGLPAPAVSINGATSFQLWLSFEGAVPAADAQEFLQLLRARYFPETELAPDAATAPVYLPPCLNPRSSKWAAFIHPGMGASFAEEPGLELAPPLAGQVGFLDKLESIGAEHFAHALAQLAQPQTQPPAPGPSDAVSSAAGDALAAEPSAWQPPAQAPVQARAGAGGDGLLLKDATLEDIVRHLHALNIEPTFRFMPPGR